MPINLIFDPSARRKQQEQLAQLDKLRQALIGQQAEGPPTAQGELPVTGGIVAQGTPQANVLDALLQPSTQNQGIQYALNLLKQQTASNQPTGATPSDIQLYNLYRQQNPDYQGNILQFHGDWQTAGQPPITKDTIQSYGQSILSGNATLRNVPIRDRGKVADWLDKQGPNSYSPEAIRKLTASAHEISKNYTNLPSYQLTLNGLPYLQRIDAAIKHPGSVSDQDLLDSLTKLTTGGNAVTEAQINTILKGKTYSDKLNTFRHKLIGHGGILSTDIRSQVIDIANEIYKNYLKGYTPVYNELTKKLKGANIPNQFWGIPDFNKISSQSGVLINNSGSQPVQQQIGRFKVEVSQ